MIRQFLQKRSKIASAILNSYIRKKGREYSDTEWWDTSFYVEGVSDRQTISPRKSVLTAKYHYASIELQILKHLRNNDVDVTRSKVVDIGSGAGHWIDFYKSLEAANVTGIDVSLVSFKHLTRKYAGDRGVDIHRGKALEVMSSLNVDYDLVNAVGVMFHIVGDSEWEETVFSVFNRLKSNGLFIVGGHFGSLDGLNVQIDRQGNINKRLRSKARWIQTLRKAGFRAVRVYCNHSYLWIEDTLPENNVLVATK